jgi:hypothetical protein
VEVVAPGQGGSVAVVLDGEHGHGGGVRVWGEVEGDAADELEFRLSSVVAGYVRSGRPCGWPSRVHIL